MSDILSVIDGRTERLPGYAYKLDSGGYAIEYTVADDLDIDENEMSVWIPFADGNRRDGVGDLLEVTGIDTSRHRQNPICLFDHGKAVQLPIGMAEDRKSKDYTVVIDPIAKVAKAKCYFYQGMGNDFPAYMKNGGDGKAPYDHALFCQQLFHLMAERFVRGGSIGYQIIHAKELPPDYHMGTPKGMHLLNVRMLECSAVVLPANMDTVRKALSLNQVCGKALSPVLVKSLSAYLPEQTKTVVGFTKELDRQGGESQKEKGFLGAVGRVVGGAAGAVGGAVVGSAVGRRVADKEDETGRKIGQYGGAATGALAGGRIGSAIGGAIGDTVSGVGGAIAVGAAGAALTAAAIMGRRKSMSELRQQYRAKAAAPTSGRPKKKDSTLQKLGRTAAAVGAGITSAYIGEVAYRAGKHPKGTAAGLAAEARGTARGVRNAYYSAANKVRKARYESHQASQPNPHGPGPIVESRAPTSRQIEHKNVEGNTDQKDVEKLGRTIGRNVAGYGALAVSAVTPLSPVRTVNRASQVGGNIGASIGRGIQKIANRVTGKKSLGDIRQRYRSTKGLVHRRKKSSPGTSIILCKADDVPLVADAAKQRGLQFDRAGTREGLEKIRLSGDDAAIDAIAAQYGKPIRRAVGVVGVKRTKSLEADMGKVLRPVVKAAPDEMNENIDDLATDPQIEGDAESPTEPLGAQVLRRLHSDHSILMRDYDAAMEHLEQEDVKNHVQQFLSSVDSMLTQTEKLFGKVYSHLNPLEEGESVEDEKDLTEDEADDIKDEIDDQVEDTEEEPIEDKDMDTIDDNGVPSSSSDTREEEEPLPEEVMEGMEEAEENELEDDAKAMRGHPDYERRGYTANTARRKSLDDDLSVIRARYKSVGSHGTKDQSPPKKRSRLATAAKIGAGVAGAAAAGYGAYKVGRALSSGQLGARLAEETSKPSQAKKAMCECEDPNNCQCPEEEKDMGEYDEKGAKLRKLGRVAGRVAGTVAGIAAGGKLGHTAGAHVGSRVGGHLGRKIETGVIGETIGRVGGQLTGGGAGGVAGAIAGGITGYRAAGRLMNGKKKKGEKSHDYNDETAVEEAVEGAGDLRNDPFDPHREDVTEASGFLRDLSETQNFGEQERMKSFHYHKLMGKIHSKFQPSDDIDPEKARQILEDGEVHGQPLTEDQRRMFGAAASKAQPGTEEWMEEEAHEPEHQEEEGVDQQSPGESFADDTLQKRLSAVANAGSLFQKLSETRDFGDPHRKMCGEMHKAMEDAFSDGDSTPDDDEFDDDEGIDAEEYAESDMEPGERGEKDAGEAPKKKGRIRRALGAAATAAGAAAAGYGAYRAAQHPKIKPHVDRAVEAVRSRIKPAAAPSQPQQGKSIVSPEEMKSILDERDQALDRLMKELEDFTRS